MMVDTDKAFAIIFYVIVRKSSNENGKTKGQNEQNPQQRKQLAKSIERCKYKWE